MDSRPDAEFIPPDLVQPLASAFFQQPLLGVGLFDADMVWQGGNTAWFQMTGLASYRRMTLMEMLPALAEMLRPFRPRLAVGEAVPPQSVHFELNGTAVNWDVAVTPLATPTGTMSIAVIIDDNTEQFRFRQQLERRIADRTQKLSALYDVISATAGAPDLRSTLSWSLKRVLEAIKCPAGAIQLINEFDEQLAVETLRLVTDEGLPESVRAFMVETAVSQELAQLVMASDHPVVIPNLDTHPAIPSPLRQQTGLHTYVGASMMVRDRVLGVLSVFTHESRVFSEIELALLDSVADQIGIVVENAYLHKQAEEAAVVEERHRLARELHDSVTQAIYSLTLFTEAGLRLLRSGNHQRIAELLNHLNDTSQQALREMRLMLHKLRPPDLEEEGLVGALQQRLDEVETRANITADLVVEGNVDDLPDGVEEQLYRIAQEALNNALKHSSASLLTVRISIDEEDIRLEVSDDGRGFDVDAAMADGGMGLQNIEERVDELYGDLTIQSQPGEGTTIIVEVDLNALDMNEEDELF